VDRKPIHLITPHLYGEELRYVNEAFESNWIAPLGPQVDAFEREIAAYVGARAAAALASGTAAMHMALKITGAGRGDVVFCSALTFAASCNPIIYEGAEPIFIDSEPHSWNMSPDALERAFDDCARENRLPKAVIVVDVYGQSANFGQILDICRAYGVPVLEDAAEALGAKYRGRHCGTLGDLGIYSFNGNKIITTSGGGMVVSDNEDAIGKIKFWSTQAKDPARHYEHSELGYNYRISNVLAAIGRGQLRGLDKRLEQKKKIYESYKAGFADIDEIGLMPVAAFGEPNYWLSVMILAEESRVSPMDIMLALENENIESRPVWKPMQLQPFYKNCRFYPHREGEKSVSEDIFYRGVCLPSDTKLTEEDLDRVIGVIRSLFS